MFIKSCLSKLLALGLLARGTMSVAPSTEEAGAPLQPPSLLPAKNLFKFPSGIWAEKEAFRKNGQQIMGTVIKPWVYLIDPQKQQLGRLLYNFPKEDYNATFAVNELEDGFFSILVGKWNASFVGYKGSMDLWTIDFRGRYGDEAKIQKHQNIPDAIVLDGAAVLNKKKGYLLAGDGNAGSLFLIDTKKKTSRAVLTDDLLKGQPGRLPPEGFGVNGVKIRNDGQVYFTGEGRGILGKVAFDVNTGEPKKGAKIKTIFSQQGRLLDDFCFGPDGSIYLSAVDKGVLKLEEEDPAGVRQIVDLPGTNSVDFGRTPRDMNTLYAGRAVFDPTGVYRVEGAVEA
ncbi:MAG: hypothetical protein M1831_002304 [Alyxoria varia]|nr:MAG: hypothetical protein M1831_002304 [Alyxoria varia]